ncbi:MAG: hypothetical protein A2W03_09070 [Candidatus Aminicenantes bacterium RBG_16_63_16]|nr:MAG: hypothetical protein A2W03_09070 [Candidatus Aminicenantes bacterium RBG_16_63_16]
MFGKIISPSSRRQFLFKVLPAGTLFCLGCKNLSGSPGIFEPETTSPQKHKFKEDAGMTVEQVFRFSFENGIPLLQTLAENVGREKFLEMLRKASAETTVQFVRAAAKDYPKRDLAAVVDLNFKMMSAPPFNKALTYEIVEQTDKAFEMKITECLMAKVLREMKAADIGYVTMCDPDGAFFREFNPKIKAANPKNLMKGDDVCVARYTWEG